MHATWFSSIQFHLNERCVNRKKCVPATLLRVFRFFFFLQFFDASTNDRRRCDGDKNEFGFAYGETKLIIVVESDANILTDAWCLRLPPCTAWAFVCRRTQYTIHACNWVYLPVHLHMTSGSSVPDDAQWIHELIETCAGHVHKIQQSAVVPVEQRNRDRRHHIVDYHWLSATAAAHAPIRDSICAKKIIGRRKSSEDLRNKMNLNEVKLNC